MLNDLLLNFINKNIHAAASIMKMNVTASSFKIAFD